MATQQTKWKNRFDLPVMARLPIQVDIDKLKVEMKDFIYGRSWDGLGAEYSSLCESHQRLPKMFFTKEELELHDCINDLNWEDSSYKQLALTEFDENYSLSNRTEMSGSLWDTRIAKKNPKADERWFRKKVKNLPPYMSEIIDQLGGVHRSRIAALAPGARVKPHIDYDTLYGIRLHIALETNSQCINGGLNNNGEIHEEHIPADGSVWFVNPGVKHWATNSGNTTRSHIILSVDSHKLISRWLY